MKSDGANRLLLVMLVISERSHVTRKVVIGPFRSFGRKQMHAMRLTVLKCKHVLRYASRYLRVVSLPAGSPALLSGRSPMKG